MMLVPMRPPMTEGISSNRVLVVDDDSDFADSMAEVLESHGYRTATAYSGAAALREMESFNPHVALIDMRLGAERGTELIERMRAQRPDLVCILMTAYAELDSAVQALRNRADDYLLKPLDPSSVLGVIRNAMSRVRELTLAERRERLASVGSLAAGVAHDLNNVLTIVLHETELIERQIRGQDDAVRTGLHSIRASTLRAAEITRNLLLIARGVDARIE
jgi:DNA-binding response OmpR family regulator